MRQVRTPSKAIYHNLDSLPIRFLKAHNISSTPFSFDRLQYLHHINHFKITLKQYFSDFLSQFDLFLVDIKDAAVGLCLFEVFIDDCLL